MKTAVSIPDPVFKGAERLARRMKKSRSQLYSDALREFLRRHDSGALTSSWEQVLADVQEPVDPQLQAAAHAVLERVEW